MRRRRARPLHLFASVGLLLATAPANAASPDICQTDDVCRAHTDRAVSLANASDYRGALSAFLAAYAVQAEPRLLVNIGRSLFHLKRFQESIQYYRRFQYAPNFRAEATMRQAASQYIAESKEAIAAARAAGVGYLVMAVGSRNTQIVIDDYEVGSTPFTRTVELSAGRHHIVLRGEKQHAEDVTIAAGKEEFFSIDAPKEGVDALDSRELDDERRLPRPAWRIYTGAASLAVGLLMVGLGAGALSINGDCAMQTLDGACGSSVNETGMRVASVYDSVGLGVGLLTPGVVLSAAGIALIAWPGPQTESAKAP